MEDFIRRYHFGDRHQQAEDRRKKLERIERVPPPREIAAPPMGFPAASRTGDIVLRVEQLAKGFPGKPLFDESVVRHPPRRKVGHSRPQRLRQDDAPAVPARANWSSTTAA